MGPKVEEIYRAFKTRLKIGAEAKNETAPEIEPVAVEYPALHIEHIFDVISGEYVKNLWEGVAWVDQKLEAEELRCKGATRYVLAGYSSGAFAVHEALAERAGYAASPSYIGAAMLLADPAKLGNGGEVEVGTAAHSATGIYTKIFGGSSIGPAPIPSTLRSRTISLCNRGDIVCAPGNPIFYISPLGELIRVLVDLRVHSSYAGEEVNELGDFAAEQALANK